MQELAVAHDAASAWSGRPAYLGLQRVPVQNREILAFPRLPTARHLPDGKQNTEESGSSEAFEPGCGEMSCHRWITLVAACGPDAIAPGATASNPPAAATPATAPTMTPLRSVVLLTHGRAGLAGQSGDACRPRAVVMPAGVDSARQAAPNSGQRSDTRSVSLDQSARVRFTKRMLPGKVM